MRHIALFALAVAILLPDAAAAQQSLQNLWDRSGQFRGTTDRNGMIYAPDGRLIGQIEPRSRGPAAGETYRGTAFRAPTGPQVPDRNRNVYGPDGQFLGQIDRNGNFRDRQGEFKGQIR